MKIIYTIILVCAAVSATASGIAMPDAGQNAVGRRLESELISLSVSTTGITISVRTEKPERFYVYSITGQLIKTIDVQAGMSESLDLNRGCYIVKCSLWSKKVMVR